jgi:hypothetical protein
MGKTTEPESVSIICALPYSTLPGHIKHRLNRDVNKALQSFASGPLPQQQTRNQPLSGKEWPCFVMILYRTALATNNLTRSFIALTAYVLYFRREYK